VEAVGSEREAQRIATSLGARDLTNLDMGARYVDACGWMVQALESLGRYAETRSSGDDCIALGDQVLAQRPGYRLVLHGQQITLGVLAQLAQDSLDPAEALQAALRQEQVSLTLLNLDPHSVVSLNNLGVAQSQLGMRCGPPAACARRFPTIRMASTALDVRQRGALFSRWRASCRQGGSLTGRLPLAKQRQPRPPWRLEIPLLPSCATVSLLTARS